MTLQEAVKEFLQILDSTEESDSGMIFSPVYISCCRIMLELRLSEILTTMRELTNETTEEC